MLSSTSAGTLARFGDTSKILEALRRDLLAFLLSGDFANEPPGGEEWEKGVLHELALVPMLDEIGVATPSEDPKAPGACGA